MTGYSENNPSDAVNRTEERQITREDAKPRLNLVDIWGLKIKHAFSRLSQPDCQPVFEVEGVFDDVMAHVIAAMCDVTRSRPGFTTILDTDRRFPCRANQYWLRFCDAVNRPPPEWLFRPMRIGPSTATAKCRRSRASQLPPFGPATVDSRTVLRRTLQFVDIPSADSRADEPRKLCAFAARVPSAEDGFLARRARKARGAQRCAPRNSRLPRARRGREALPGDRAGTSLKHRHLCRARPQVDLLGNRRPSCVAGRRNCAAG
jgi:hypothetical protein